MAEPIVKTSRGPIEVSRVYKSDFQKEGSLTAELKQVETTITEYPAKSVSNSLQDNVFDNSDFGYGTTDFKSEKTNVAWILVPEGSDVEAVKARLALKVKACLYRITDNKPILSDNQMYGISQGLKTMSDYANSQVVRHGTDDEDGRWAKNDLVLDNLGRPVYKAAFLSVEPKENINRSTSNPLDYFASEEIKAEMEGIHAPVAGQTI